MIVHTILLLKSKSNNQGTLEVCLLLMSSAGKLQAWFSIKARLDLDSHLFFNWLLSFTVSHKNVSFISKLFERAVVKFENGAIESYFDIFWSLRIIGVVASTVNRLSIKVVSKRRLVAEEVFKDLEALALVSVTSLESSVFLALDVLEAFESILVVDCLQVLVAKDLVCFTKTVEQSHISRETFFLSHWVVFNCKLSVCFGHIIVSSSLAIKLQNFVVTIHFECR